jgi:methane monooxygenase regulatory protein B
MSQESAKEFMADFLAEENMVVKESRNVVLVLMKNEEMDIVVEEIILKEELEKNPSIVVEDHAAFWHIKAEGGFTINSEDVAELLGRPYNIYDFLVNVSSTVGRAYTTDETFTITTDLMGLDKDLE